MGFGGLSETRKVSREEACPLQRGVGEDRPAPEGGEGLLRRVRLCVALACDYHRSLRLAHLHRRLPQVCSGKPGRALHPRKRGEFLQRAVQAAGQCVPRYTDRRSVGGGRGVLQSRQSVMDVGVVQN